MPFSIRASLRVGKFKWRIKLQQNMDSMPLLETTSGSLTRRKLLRVSTTSYYDKLTKRFTMEYELYSTDSLISRLFVIATLPGERLQSASLDLPNKYHSFIGQRRKRSIPVPVESLEKLVQSELCPPNLPCRLKKVPSGRNHPNFDAIGRFRL